MARQLSFSKYEQELRPELRQNLNIAESTEDVKKFFVYTIQKLFGRVLEGKEAFTYEDIRLDPQEQSGFIISDKLLGDPEFASVWSNSDLVITSYSIHYTKLYDLTIFHLRIVAMLL